MSEFERKLDAPEENDGRTECERCAEQGCRTESGACGGCAGTGCLSATTNGCGGCCPHAAGNEFQWDYDDTVLVFSSDMLDELP